MNFSIVIITNNEAHVLERTLSSLKDVTDDIIIVDSGSTDLTLQIASNHGASIFQTEWLGFGPAKNFGNAKAKYEWILSLDADEAIDDKLKNSLANPALFNDHNVVYDIPFKSFIGEKNMRYGQWFRNHHIRLFNKKYVHWNDFSVHEKLIIPANSIIKKLEGNVLHYTMQNFAEFAEKINKYAGLSAEKYFAAGKKVAWHKLYLTPSFTFFINYFIKGGILDGWQGLVSAGLSAHYSFLKYALLKEKENYKKQ